MNNQIIVVRVPATSANLGPGFDTLGLALALYNTTAVSVRLKPARGDRPTDMIRAAVAAFFRTVRRRPRPVAVSVRGDVPVSRGLGSSVTVRLGVVAGLNRLHGEPLSAGQMLDLVADLEGHPDNAAPALLGGFVVSGRITGRVRTFRVNAPRSWKFVAVIPEIEIETEQARKLLPRTVTLGDAVANVTRTAFITGAFATGQAALLRDVFDDRFHQPYRQQLLPPLFDVIKAGESAGALGGWLSGSGSTIVCVTATTPHLVARAMTAVLDRAGFRSRPLVLSADNRGMRYIDEG